MVSIIHGTAGLLDSRVPSLLLLRSSGLKGVS